MKPLTKRKLIDFFVGQATFLGLYFAGAGLWALLLVPYGLWNYYDGQTRMHLK